jgi:threonine/homoserine/homoserine lactone efflux protein
MLPAIIKGITLGLLLAIGVGPVIFSIIKQSLSHGHKGGYAFITGVSASDLSIILVCNLFSSLFQSAMDHEKIIGGVGSAFLITMGINNMFFKKVKVTATATPELKIFKKRELVFISLQGFLMNTLNPSVFIFWLGTTTLILADSKTEIHPIEYRIIVFTTCLLFTFSSDVAKVLLANKIRTSLTPHNIHIVNRISGLIFIGFGVALIWGIIFGKNLGH